MDGKTNSYKLSELNSLRTIGQEFWCNFDDIYNKKGAKEITNTNLGSLIKLQKSLNNTLMKMTAKMSHDLEMSKLTDNMAKVQISDPVIPDEAQSQVV